MREVFVLQTSNPKQDTSEGSDFNREWQLDMLCRLPLPSHAKSKPTRPIFLPVYPTENSTRRCDNRFTLGVYTHVELHDQTAATEALPAPPAGHQRLSAVSQEAVCVVIFFTGARRGWGVKMGGIERLVGG